MPRNGNRRKIEKDVCNAVSSIPTTEKAVMNNLDILSSWMLLNRDA